MTILLTTQLREDVEAAVEAAYLKAEEHYKQKFPRPEVRYDIRNTNGGEAWAKVNRIRLNLTFLLENREKFLATTVPHEVAHLVAHLVYDSKPMNGKKVRPHGKEWKEVMGVLSLEPKVCHTYSVESLDLHRKAKNRRLVSIQEKTMRLLKQLEKLPENQRNFIACALTEMGDA